MKEIIFQPSYLLNRTVVTISSQKCNLHITERLKDGLQKNNATIKNPLKLGNIKMQHITHCHNNFRLSKSTISAKHFHRKIAFKLLLFNKNSKYRTNNN